MTRSEPDPTGGDNLCLVTVLHERTESFCHAVAHRAAYEMAARGWAVELNGPGDATEQVAEAVGAVDALVFVHDDSHVDLPTRCAARARHRLVMHVSDHQPSTRPVRDRTGALRVRFGPLVGSTPEIRTAWLEELETFLAPAPENRAG